MSMMKSQVLESAYSSETQKYKYLDNETLFYLEAKKKSSIIQYGL